MALKPNLTDVKPGIRLGYACINTELRQQHIFTGRTCRYETIVERGLPWVRELIEKNLADLMQIIQWNEAHNIRFFRISSDMFPHITNPRLIKNRGNYKRLAYSLKPFRIGLAAVGKYARDHGHRLTFHPDQYVNLGGTDSIVITSCRDLWFHAMVLDMMELDLNSVMIIHGGGVYGNKAATMARWITAFNNLDIVVKRRVVIENDEHSYGIVDIMALSSGVKPYLRGASRKYKIPIVFDIFHYSCYTGDQLLVADILPDIVESWLGRTVKMHISEQRPNSRMGAHSDYVRTIPKILLQFPKKFGINLDLMIEAKQKELAVLRLKKTYHKYLN